MPNVPYGQWIAPISPVPEVSLKCEGAVRRLAPFPTFKATTLLWRRRDSDSATFHQELIEIGKVLFDDLPNDFQIDLVIVVDGNVPEPNHRPHLFCGRWRELFRPFEQCKRFPACLRHAGVLSG